MFELDLRLDNDTPFAELSKMFPDVKFYRWCNSSVDYLVFYGSDYQLNKVEEALPSVVKSLNSKILHKARENDRLDVMVACRCTVDNSTIRMIESNKCLWQAPVSYLEGRENVAVSCVDEIDCKKTVDLLSKHGEVQLIKKKRIDPGMLQESYLIPISTLFEDLTLKQLKSLRTAIENDFFSEPKKATIEDLASIIGVSKSTVQEHLSKGIMKIFKAMEPYINMMISIKESAR